jgi:hypothetical protein
MKGTRKSHWEGFHIGEGQLLKGLPPASLRLSLLMQHTSCGVFRPLLERYRALSSNNGINFYFKAVSSVSALLSNRSARTIRVLSLANDLFQLCPEAMQSATTRMENIRVHLLMQSGWI